MRAPLCPDPVVLNEDIIVLTILSDVMNSLQGVGEDLEDISLETAEGDPSWLRNITDLIYDGCWWRGEGPVSGGDIYDELTKYYVVG